MRDLIDLFFLTFLQYSRISSLSVMQLFLSVEETHRPCSPICWARYTSPGSHKVATLRRGKIRSLKVCTLASKRKTHLAQSTTLSKCFASQEIIHLNYRTNQSLSFLQIDITKKSIRFFIITIIASYLLKTMPLYAYIYKLFIKLFICNYFVYNHLQIFFYRKYFSNFILLNVFLFKSKILF